MIDTAATAFVYPQDRAKLLFYGVAFGADTVIFGKYDTELPAPAAGKFFVQKQPPS